MKYIFLVLVFGQLCLAVFSQQSRIEYILKYQSLAIREMTRSGIPASITMAQACLESGDGQSTLAKTSNNHFGIKCRAEWMGEKVYFDDDAKDECFRKYNTIEDSYIDHTDFLIQNSRYRSLFDLGSTNYKGWAKGLKQAGYATDSRYGEKLIEIIEKFELFKLDQKIELDELALFEKKKWWQRSETRGTMVIDAFQIHPVSLRNGVKSIVAIEGDNYGLIAQEFGLEEWEVTRFNDQPQGYVPQVNEVVYIKSKKYRSSKSKQFHTAETDDTMHYISQKYGIKLRPLLTRNQMKPGDEPVPGQIIHLRKKSKTDKS